MAFISDRLLGAAAAALLAAGVLAAPSVSAQTSAPAVPQAAPSASSATGSAPSVPAPKARSTRRSRLSRVDAYINSLHKRLMITKAQEGQWNAVAEAMRENAKEIDRLASERSAKRASMNAVDNLRSYQAIADAHADGMKKLVPAFSALYDSMSAAQKKNADAVFAHMPRRRGRAKAG